MADIVFRPEGFKEAASSLEGSRELILTRMNQMLRRVGQLLVPALKAKTPVGASHHLRNYTVFSIRGMAEDMIMEVRQSAQSDTGYFYGMAVIGGTRPHFPPYRKLIPWVQAVLGVTGKKATSVAFLVARKISEVGTQPNPYPTQVLNENIAAIQGIVDQEGVSLSAELWKPRRG